MCLILVAWRSHPNFPFVVAANRDETFSRLTATADFWPEHPHLLAGRDLNGGGTWMGITRTGRFAALTNYRAPAEHRKDAPSRGRLVSDFLAGDDSIDAYLKAISSVAPAYNGFNLLLSDGHQLVWFSNVGNQHRALAPGIYGVSNHLLDTNWPKVSTGKTALAESLSALPDTSRLRDLLCDDHMHPESCLPRTGVSAEWERLLSSAFVRAPGYGTRSSTVLLVDAGNRCRYVEWTWPEYPPTHVAGELCATEAAFEFNLLAAAMRQSPPKSSGD